MTCINLCGSKRRPVKRCRYDRAVQNHIKKLLVTADNGLLKTAADNIIHLVIKF